MGELIDLTAMSRLALLERDFEHKAKESFWASDCERNVFDLYHAWAGTPPTNPFDAKSLWRFACGKSAETELLKLFKESEILEDSDDQYRIEFKWEGIPISGYADAKLKDGTVCEIKSFYGPYQDRDLLAGRPKVSYLKQLAVYMFAEKSEIGILYMVPMPMGEHYQFVLRQTERGKFQCNDVTFDLAQEFNRWRDLYNDHISQGIEPESEYQYKYPVDTMDWTKVSKSDISKARNGHKVIGDWQAVYSPYLDLIIEREGTERGYSPEELALIKEATAGYTTR